MNKQRYRLIHNAARGILMAVAEHVSGHGKGSRRVGRAPVGGPTPVLTPLAFSLWLAQGLVFWPLVAGADIVADPNAPGNQRPTVLATGNGVPLVNIQTPSAAGVSRNTYSQFDVANQGAILNNNHANAPTQLGGWVQGNPWLATGEARVILNEVNSVNPSLLNGYLEVAGRRAEVVIANPAGIQVDGGGFINASRATLVTGVPILNGGALEGYRVESGLLRVSGAGLDASTTDYADLIARAVEINAGIWAKDIKATTGANRVDAANTTATAIAGTGPAPAFAIDTAALGGMYAGKITLVATEAGVGVRNAGALNASAGDLLVTTDGRLENTGSMLATGTASLTTTGNLTNTGTAYAQGNLTLSTLGDIDNLGILAAQGNTRLQADGDIDSATNALIAAGLRTDGTLADTGNLTIAATARIAANGQNLAGGDQTLTARDIDLTDSQTEARAALTIDAQQNLATDRATLTGRDLLIAATDITHAGATLFATRQLTLASDTLTGDGTLLSQGDLTIDLTRDHTHTGEIRAMGDARLTTTGALTNQSLLLANQTLTVEAAHIDNQSDGEIGAVTTVITTPGTLTNRGLIDGQDTRIDADTLDNLGTGRLFGDQISLAAQTLTNDTETVAGIRHDAVIAARDRLDIGVQTLANREGSLIFSAGDLAIGGHLDANRLVAGRSRSLDNTSATIESLGALAIATEALNNTNAHLTWRIEPLSSSQKRDDFDSQNYREYTETIQHAVITESRPGRLQAGGNMQIDASVSALNQDSEIIAGGLMSLTGQTIDNRATEVNAPTLREGTAYSYGVIGEDCSFLGSKCDPEYGWRSSPYSESIDRPVALAALRYEANASAGAGYDIGALANVISPENPGGTPPRTSTSTLYALAPDPASHYLIETDPRFADYRTWLSSDTMLQALSVDTATTQKRLGDGFYEQRLIREQVARLTGQRFLADHTSDEAQYRALMAAGVTYAQGINLVPGIALSADQVAQLTSDIVWLVEETVTLPNGQIAQALVPRVYLAPREGDLSPGGALIAADSLHIGLAGDLTNSGTLAGRQVVRLDAQNIRNTGGLITANVARLSARDDIVNTGGALVASDALSLNAGRDLAVTSTTAQGQGEAGAGQYAGHYLDRVAGLYVTGQNGLLVAQAGRDLALTGARVDSAGDTVLTAGRDLVLGTVDTGTRSTVDWNNRNYAHLEQTAQTGSQITGEHIDLNAGRDITTRAARVEAADTLTAAAGRDIAIAAGSSTYQADTASYAQGGGLFGSASTQTRTSTQREDALASQFGGSTVTVNAGRDIAVTGSQAISDRGTTLQAGRDLTIEAAQTRLDQTDFVEQKHSGLMSSGGIGFTIGSRQQSTDTQGQSLGAATSTVGSVEGNVTLTAGERYRQTGSDVLAPKGDIAIAAQRVDINEARETRQSQTETKFRQSGLTVSLGGGIIDTAQSVAQAVQGATSGDSDRSRLNALIAYGKGSDLAEQGKAIGQAYSQNGIFGSEGQPGVGAASGIKISVSVGSSKSQSTSATRVDTVAGSTVKSGGNIEIRATEGDLTVQGSQVHAAQNLDLNAAQNLNIVASRNEEGLRSDNKSRSASVGVSFGIGSGSAGLSLDIAASQGKGQANSDSVTYDNSHVTAGDTASIRSGADTTIRGGNVAGKQVVADVGGNLAIESLQDTASSAAKQSNSGFAVSIPIYGGGGSASVSQANQKSRGNYQSVNEQSGIQAGDGGFQVDVRGNTDLKGAVIASTAGADTNRLATGTLTTGDIENRMSASANSSGVSVGTHMLQGKYELAKGLAGNAMNHGEAGQSNQSTTRSAISTAQVSVAGQTTDSSNATLTDSNGKAVSTDTSNAHRALGQADMAALQQSAQQQQADNMLVVKTATTFTDEAYRTMYQAGAKLYRVPPGCNDQSCAVPLTEQEAKALQASQDGKVHISNNGIFNDLDGAVKYAQQHGGLMNADGTKDYSNKPENQYIIFMPNANNVVSELVVAAIQKSRLTPYVGLTNSEERTARLLEQAAQQGQSVVLDSHSRGTLTTDNAMRYLIDQGGIKDANGNTISPIVQLNNYGGAQNNETGNLTLQQFTGRSDVQINSVVHPKDLVGVTPVVGNNPATQTYTSTNPTTAINPPTVAKDDGTSPIGNFWNILTGTATPHNCYGTASKECDGQWENIPKSNSPKITNPDYKSPVVIPQYQQADKITPQVQKNSNTQMNPLLQPIQSTPLPSVSPPTVVPSVNIRLETLQNFKLEN